VKVLVVDDHAVVREGVTRILSELPGISTIDQAGEGRTALELARVGNYDVIILDIAMPGGDGIDLLKQLKVERPASNIIILTVFPEDQFAIRTLKAGALAFLTKDRAPIELVAAVKRVAEGKRYITSSLAERIADDYMRGGNDDLRSSFSDRELQVLSAIASGKTASQIGRQLRLSVKTISTYRTRILKKTGLKTTSELIRFAIDKGIDHLSLHQAHAKSSDKDGAKRLHLHRD
jgi:two-component system, NarL family, invasion response regulator UvrY